MTSKNIVAAIFYLFSFVTLTAQPGSLDEDFGTDGIVRLSLGGVNDVLNAMAIQADDKIVTAGFSSQNAALVRFTSDGSLDSTFGEGGKVFSNFGYYYNSINAIAIQADGKIVAVARGNMNFSNNARLILVRYNEDGTLDESFGENGFTIVDTGFSSSNGRAIVIQPDGRILVTMLVSNLQIVISRFQPDGLLDETFGSNGLQLVSFGDNPASASTILLQADDKIIVGGFLRRPMSSIQSDFAIARLLENGSFDTSFGNNGVVVTQISMESNSISDMAIQADNRIVAVGSIALGIIPNKIGVARYLVDGTLDSSFGNNGIVITQLQNRDIRGVSCVLQPDGKILAGGSTSNSESGDDFLLVRYTPEGFVDTEFGNDGAVITEISTSNDRINELALQADGKIVAAGEISLLEFVVTRYLSDLDVGAVEFSFTQNSLLVYPNPIREMGTLKYTLLTQENLSLQLFDFSGTLIKTYIEKENRSKGEHLETFTFPFDAPPGPYVLVLSGASGKISVKVFR